MKARGPRRGEEAGQWESEALSRQTFGGYNSEEEFMETRMFERPVKVQSTDGEYVETFDTGERVKNVMRIGRRVMFEPVSTHRIVRTYAMDWAEFQRATTAVREAHS
jgi:hypothetical protein